MPRWVIVPHGISPDIHIPIIIEQIRRVRHQGIRADELAQFGVIGSASSPTVADVVIVQTGVVEFLAGELVTIEEPPNNVRGYSFIANSTNSLLVLFAQRLN